MSVNLPAGLAGPLAFPDDAPTWWPWAVLVLLAIAFLVYRAWRRHRSRLETPRQTRAPARSKSPDDSVDAIEERNLDAGTYRRGCHELADLLRERAAWTLRDGGADPEKLTARELMASSGNAAAADLMLKLAGKRFARREPDKADFRTACTLTRAVLRVPRS